MEAAAMIRFPRFTAALLSAGLAFVGAAVGAAAPAAAATVGYVRLAHLSPDTPPVDVYLAPVAAGSKAQKFPAVGYGVVSAYLPLPAGTYAVAMRNNGAPESTAPVLSTQVTVSAGAAYTVAGVGRFADLGLRVINDDLAKPAPGKAKVRVVQASAKAPTLNVSGSTGAAIANGVAFATTTDYREVEPGPWKLKLQPAGSGTATEVAANCQAGNVYSVLVLDGKNGLTVEVRTDARGGTVVPAGGSETGAGGTQRSPLRSTGALALLASALVFAGALAGLLTLRRRSRLTNPA
jgi:hypothetical protein